MSEYNMMARISALEANDRIFQEYMKRSDATLEKMANNITEIRDAIIGTNLPKIPERVSKLELLPKRVEDLEDLPDRVTELEKSRWISHGVVGTIAGGTGFGLAKFLSFIGLFSK